MTLTASIKKYIKQWFADHFPNLMENVAKLTYVIPKLHLQGHKDECQYKYSLNYKKCCGCTGESQLKGHGQR